MPSLANMTGLALDVRGVHEPSRSISEIARVFSLKEEGGILSRHCLVEMANSVAESGKTVLDAQLKMGVFVVIRSDHPFIQEYRTSCDLHLSGNGKNFLPYSPYNLVAVEAPISIAIGSALLHGYRRSVIQTKGGCHFCDQAGFETGRRAGWERRICGQRPDRVGRGRAC